MTEQEHDNDKQGIRVSSDLNPDGTANYIVTVSADDDIALSLMADDAVRYVVTVNRAAVIAQHDAAVMVQLSRTLKLDKRTAGLTVLDLRKDREPVNDAATAPLRFEPIVSATSFAPYVHVWARKQCISQWTPQDCFQHAGQVLKVLAAVDLDAAYYRYLVHTIKIDKRRARSAVHDLGNYGLRDEPS